MSKGGVDPTPDWTAGPAKWAAVVFLGISSVVGMGWSMFRASARAPVGEARAPASPSESSPTPVVHPTPAAALAPAPPASLSRKINLNTATAAELELLPGIGPAVAQRIIEYRSVNGAFKRIEDLDQVKGVGPRTIEKLRDLVTTE